ncbi:short-chain dehydrogenase reductase sdr [Purpureocillium lavendulum]|uniref:Short-chain dehydrogenase reductase sdr n=1 Tax=Purpureocillium lavendulum TaxID=1247861 RepID=A0AB34G269_9HYPO|nr:short-chain dehydrogenase reductase sdr [Purpureocillium lavendulum]
MGATSNAGSYLARPPGDCCTKGCIHEGQPRGEYETIAGVETYIVQPPADRANGHIVLYLADVFGLYTNGLLVMDSFANAGYLVLGLDYFCGDPIWKHRPQPEAGEEPSYDIRDWMDPDFDFHGWLNKHIAFADEAVPRWTAAVKEQYGQADTKYACVGYCFGAPYVCDLLARDVVSAGAFAHPASLKDHHFANIKGPLFLSCTQDDYTFPNESRRKALDILHKGDKTWALQLFTNVEHGFALRSDLDDPYQRYVKDASFRGIVEWFDAWLSQRSG